MKQNLIVKLQEILSNQGIDEIEIIQQIKNLIYEYETHDGLIKESKTISLLVSENFKTIQSDVINTNIIKSGYRDLDSAIGGLLLGEFVVVGGRPSMGKTQFLVSLVLNVSITNPVLYFTFDLSESFLTNRFISALSGVAVSKIIQNNLNPFEKNQISSIEDLLSSRKIFINDSSSNSTSSIKSLCKKHIQEDGVKVIVVDFLQMMSSSRYRNNRELEIGYISRELKNIAKDNNVCVIATSQLNRSVETRGGNKRPQLSDLRDSGSIEQDADKVIFIHRPEYYGFMEDEDGNDLSGIVELIIAKNRNGKIDYVTVRRDSNFTRFIDIDKTENYFAISSSRLNEIDNPF